MTDALMTTYKRLPVCFERGEGALLFDTQGRSYLDLLTGVAVCNLGHSHPEVAQAVCDQATRLLHTSNHFRIAHQERLGEVLTALSGMERAFFCNSGAEANEAAIKLARLHGHRKGIDEPMILVMDGSFHGRTLATLTATGNRKVQAGFEPLVKGFVRVPYADVGAVRAAARNQPKLVAVLVEPVQGEGGVVVPPPGYLAALRAICDEHDWLLMLDEVQTGMGRTGRPFACQHDAVVPDVMTLAKALGNGVPIGACLAHGEAAGLFGPGSHGSTFGGNPLACRAALAVLEVMQRDRLWDRAALLGERFRAGLAEALKGLPGIIEIRGRGLLIGIELDRPCAELVPTLLTQGVIINVTAERVVRLLPPLILSEQQIDEVVPTLATAIRDFLTAAR